MAGIRITVRGADEIASRFADSEARKQKLASAMEAHLALIWQTVVPLTPVGVTGHLRGSWHPDPPVMAAGHIVGILGSPLVYAQVLEEGRTPSARMPPPEAIASWVATKMGGDVDPFVVARSIGRKGITARRMLQKALDATDPAARAIWARAVAGLLGGA